jgi:toxin HigB-1
VAEILYTEGYIRKASRFIKQHPAMQTQYLKTLKLLEINPSHPSLRLHRLKGRLKDLHAVSINIAFRIILYFRFEKGQIVPVDIGSHDEVY